MRVVGLISGGKDSIFNVMQCIAAGHNVVALANIRPKSGEELDSYMYQSVGHEAIDLMAAAFDLPLFKQDTLGKSTQLNKNYQFCDTSDEVEDLYYLLKTVKEAMGIEGVSVGAILSDYQRLRVENVCIRLGLVSLSYLWQRNQIDLLNEMIQCEMDAIIIKVAALGLEPNKHLGKTLSYMQPHLLAMSEKYGLNVCGEGGEYETLTLDCPLFTSRLVVEDFEIISNSDDSIAPVGYMKFRSIKLEKKLPVLNLTERLKALPLKNGYLEQSEEELTESEEEITEEPEVKDLLQNMVSYSGQEPTAAATSDGWLIIGGIKSSGTDSIIAMRSAMEQLNSILKQHGHTTKSVCTISMFVNDMAKYLLMNKLYVENFNHLNPPSRACVEVPLPEDCPVIIDVISWAPPENKELNVDHLERSTMHVQSRSHWAPSNIGPYSQSVRVGDQIFLAGQIGLVPMSLELVSGGIKRQCQLSLRHIARLLKAVDKNLSYRDVVQGICYVTQGKYVEPARQMWEAKSTNSIVDYVVVSGLPRNALVEWSVWAHCHNTQFEYEETGRCVEDYSISIFRRWNFENNISAVVCHVEDSTNKETIDLKVIEESILYSLEKLQKSDEQNEHSVYTLKIFSVISRQLPLEKIHGFLNEVRTERRNLLVYSIVPVIELKNKNIFLSIYGFRTQ